MKQYKIFENPQGIIEVVKQGWSWPAACFNFIWAFVKKMYGLGAILLVIALVFTAIARGTGEEVPVGFRVFIFLLSCVITSVVGVIGNKLLEKSLLKRGFILKDALSANTPDFAIQVYKQTLLAGGKILTEIDNKLLTRDNKLLTLSENAEFILFLKSNESILRAIIQQYQNHQQVPLNPEEKNQTTEQDTILQQQLTNTTNEQSPIITSVSEQEKVPTIQQETPLQEPNTQTQENLPASEVSPPKVEVSSQQEEIAINPSISTKPIIVKDRITIFCQHCQQKYPDVPAHFIGRTVKCKRCRKKFIVTIPNNSEYSTSSSQAERKLLTPQVPDQIRVIKRDSDLEENAKVAENQNLDDNSTPTYVVRITNESKNAPQFIQSFACVWCNKLYRVDTQGENLVFRCIKCKKQMLVHFS